MNLKVPSFILAALLLGACGMVSNGTVHDSAEIPLADVRTVRVPERAEVEFVESGTTIRAEMAKTLAFAGHPPRRMSIRETAKNMGVATRMEGDLMELATYGEWDSQIEGGAFIELTLVVPKHISVVRGTSLSGPDSVAQGWDNEDADPRGDPDTYGYVPTKPAKVWTAYPGE